MKVSRTCDTILTLYDLNDIQYVKVEQYKMKNDINIFDSFNIYVLNSSYFIHMKYSSQFSDYSFISEFIQSEKTYNIFGYNNDSMKIFKLNDKNLLKL